MIPDNPNIYTIDKYNISLVSPYQFPDDKTPKTELESYEMGGIALQDPSEGLKYQPWYGYWNPTDETVYLCPNITGTPIPIFTEPDVVEFAFTFDQNMRWSAVTRHEDNTVNHRWYDTSVANYVITPYTDMKSVAITLDDKRDLQIQSGVTDIIFTYLDLTGGVHWRVQRDRFLIQYTHTDSVPPRCYITHFGMNSKQRLQWRFELRGFT